MKYSPQDNSQNYHGSDKNQIKDNQKQQKLNCIHKIHKLAARQNCLEQAMVCVQKCQNYINPKHWESKHYFISKEALKTSITKHTQSTSNQIQQSRNRIKQKFNNLSKKFKNIQKKCEDKVKYLVQERMLNKLQGKSEQNILYKIRNQRADLLSCDEVYKWKELKINLDNENDEKLITQSLNQLQKQIQTVNEEILSKINKLEGFLQKSIENQNDMGVQNDLLQQKQSMAVQRCIQKGVFSILIAEQQVIVEQSKKLIPTKRIQDLVKQFEKTQSYLFQPSYQVNNSNHQTSQQPFTLANQSMNQTLQLTPNLIVNQTHQDRQQSTKYKMDQQIKQQPVQKPQQTQMIQQKIHQNVQQIIEQPTNNQPINPAIEQQTKQKQQTTKQKQQTTKQKQQTTKQKQQTTKQKQQTTGQKQQTTKKIIQIIRQNVKNKKITNQTNKNQQKINNFKRQNLKKAFNNTTILSHQVIVIDSQSDQKVNMQKEQIKIVKQKVLNNSAIKSSIDIEETNPTKLIISLNTDTISSSPQTAQNRQLPLLTISQPKIPIKINKNTEKMDQQVPQVVNFSQFTEQLKTIFKRKHQQKQKKQKLKIQQKIKQQKQKGFSQILDLFYHNKTLDITALQQSQSKKNNNEGKQTILDKNQKDKVKIQEEKQHQILNQIQKQPNNSVELLLKRPRTTQTEKEKQQEQNIGSICKKIVKTDHLSSSSQTKFSTQIKSTNNSTPHFLSLSAGIKQPNQLRLLNPNVEQQKKLNQYLQQQKQSSKKQSSKVFIGVENNQNMKMIDEKEKNVRKQKATKEQRNEFNSQSSNQYVQFTVKSIENRSQMPFHKIGISLNKPKQQENHLPNKIPNILPQLNNQIPFLNAKSYKQSESLKSSIIGRSLQKNKSITFLNKPSYSYAKEIGQQSSFNPLSPLSLKNIYIKGEQKMNPLSDKKETNIIYMVNKNAQNQQKQKQEYKSKQGKQSKQINISHCYSSAVDKREGNAQNVFSDILPVPVSNQSFIPIVPLNNELYPVRIQNPLRNMHNPMLSIGRVTIKKTGQQIAQQLFFNKQKLNKQMKQKQQQKYKNSLQKQFQQQKSNKSKLN